MSNVVKYQVFKDSAGNYWWRLRAGNGQIVANSAEGYSAKETAKTMVTWMRGNAGASTVEDLA